jgi:serine/threonine protein phosphatase PrpC
MSPQSQSSASTKVIVRTDYLRAEPERPSSRAALRPVQSAALSSVGRRDNNEDAVLHAPELGLFAVADGMGGYEGGEVASQLAIVALEETYRRMRNDTEATFPWRLDGDKTLEENLLVAALRLANRAIVSQRTGRLRDMGSTVVALALCESGVVIAHVGDSRIYRLRGGELTQLTVDHSLFEEVRRSGIETAMRSKRDCSFANVITRALGLPDRAEPEVRTLPVESGDLFLLCSDGFSDPLPDAEIEKLLRDAVADGGALHKNAATKIVAAAYEAGSKDNISALLVQVR